MQLNRRQLSRVANRVADRIPSDIYTLWFARQVTLVETTDQLTEVRKVYTQFIHDLIMLECERAANRIKV